MSPDTIQARAAILKSIRDALGAEAQPNEIHDEYSRIPRSYRRRGPLDSAARLRLFEERLTEYGAGVFYAPPDGISTAVAQILISRKKRHIVIPDGLNASWLPPGFDFTDGSKLDVYQLDRSEGVLTGCGVAIAETGSIVLQTATGQGSRMLSLVPDYHLCIVLAQQVVETVPESFDRLAATAHLPTTFISGPSATADIEMTRIQGVHGPRVLDVIVAG